MKYFKVRIIIADDHRLFREGLLELLKQSSSIEVVGEAANGKELVQAYFQMKPDLILVDISMPELSGLEAFERIKEKDKSVKALFLSMHTEEIYYYQIYRSGGMGLINKNIFAGELETAISWVIAGTRYFGPNYTQDKLESLVKKYENFDIAFSKEKTILTEREEEILKLIYDGKTSIEIADELQLSKRTIDNHRFSIMKKSNAKNLMDLFKFAQEYFNVSLFH